MAKQPIYVKIMSDIENQIKDETLKSGDSIKFQIGVLAKKDLVDEKNVFLYLRFRETPEKGNPVPLVDVLGRYNNE